MTVIYAQIFDLFSGLELYILTVLVVAGLILFWGLLRLRQSKEIRIETAEEMDISSAIDTELMDGAAERDLRKSAISNIRARYNFIGKVFIPAVFVLTVIFIVLPMLPTMSASYVSLTVAILAALTGLAAKPVIENAIAGIVLTISQPIRINDTVLIEGRYGTVEKINVLYTVIKIWNWRRYIIPNYQLLQKEFENLSREDELEWSYIEFFVEPSVDINLVEKIAKESVLECNPWNVEEPSFWVMEMGKDAIKCWVAGWAKTPADAWKLKANTRRALITKLAENNIAFQKIHLKTN